MATKPGTTPVPWATDATHPTGSDPWSGLANKDTPSAGRIAQGWEPEDNPPAEWSNYILNNFYQWLKFLEELYTPTEKTVQIPPVVGVQEESGVTRGWSPFNAGGDIGHVESVENGSRLHFDIGSVVPDGAEIIEIEMIVVPGAARTGSNRMNMTFSRIAQLTGAPGSHTQSNGWSPSSATLYDNGTTSAQRVTSGAFSLTLDKAGNIYTLMVQCGVDGGPHNPDTVKGVFVTYNDPGPNL